MVTLKIELTTGEPERTVEVDEHDTRDGWLVLYRRPEGYRMLEVMRLRLEHVLSVRTIYPDIAELSA